MTKHHSQHSHLPADRFPLDVSPIASLLTASRHLFFLFSWKLFVHSHPVFSPIVSSALAITSPVAYHLLVFKLAKIKSLIHKISLAFRFVIIIRLVLNAVSGRQHKTRLMSIGFSSYSCIHAVSGQVFDIKSMLWGLRQASAALM